MAQLRSPMAFGTGAMRRELTDRASTFRFTDAMLVVTRQTRTHDGAMEEGRGRINVVDSVLSAVIAVP